MISFVDYYIVVNSNNKKDLSLCSHKGIAAVRHLKVTVIHPLQTIENQKL